MRPLLLIAVLLAGCSAPTADLGGTPPTETTPEQLPAPDLWADCRLLTMELDVPADGVELPDGFTPAAGTLPGTVLYGLWNMACAMDSLSVGYVVLDTGDGFAAWAMGTNTSRLADVAVGATPVIVSNGNYAEAGAVRLRSAAGFVRIGAVVQDATPPLEATLHTTDPYSRQALSVALVDAAGPVATLQAAADFHPAVAEAHTDGSLPWTGVATGTGWIHAPGAISPEPLSIEWQ